MGDGPITTLLLISYASGAGGWGLIECNPETVCENSRIKNSLLIFKLMQVEARVSERGHEWLHRLKYVFSSRRYKFCWPRWMCTSSLKQRTRVPSINNVPYNNALLVLIYRGRKYFVHNGFQLL